MTENEAKAKLERTRVLWGRGAKTEIVEAVKIAIQALEDVRQYRAIGTVEECRAAVEKMKSRNTCTDTECPYYQTDEDCPARNGCGGYQSKGEEYE